MIPVKQSKLYAKDGIHSGNCYAACIASLLDLPLWMVPPFEDMFARGEWRERTDVWLAKMFHVRMCRKWEHIPEQLPKFYIANGPSPRGVDHSVIFSNGKLIHDPHPSDAGIEKVEWVYWLEPIPKPDGEGAGS